MQDKQDCDMTILNGSGWQLERERIGSDGRDLALCATTEQCNALAKALDLEFCRDLRFDGTIAAASRGTLRLRGRLRCLVEQSCVISLDGLASDVDERVDIVFVRDDDLKADEAAEELADGPDIVPLDGGTMIDIGRQIYEILVVSLDPFPRKQGAEMVWAKNAVSSSGQSPSNDQHGEDSSPFAALRTLKGET